MSAFTSKDPRCADVLARLEFAKKSMRRTLLTGMPYKPAASHLAPPKPHEPATVTPIRKRK